MGYKFRKNKDDEPLIQEGTEKVVEDVLIEETVSIEDSERVEEDTSTAEDTLTEEVTLIEEELEKASGNIECKEDVRNKVSDTIKGIPNKVVPIFTKVKDKTPDKVIKGVSRAKDKVVALKDIALSDNELKDAVTISVEDVKPTRLDKAMKKKVQRETNFFWCYIEELLKSRTVPIFLVLLILCILGGINSTQTYAIPVSIVIFAMHLGLVFLKNKKYIKNKVKRVNEGLCVLAKTDEDEDYSLTQVSELNMGMKIKAVEGMIAPCDLSVLSGSLLLDDYNNTGRSEYVKTNSFVKKGAKVVEFSDNVILEVASEGKEPDVLYSTRYKSTALTRLYKIAGVFLCFSTVLMLLASWVYGLTVYNTILNIVTGLLCCLPISYMLALIYFDSKENMSFTGYIKNILHIGSCDVVAFDVADIVGDRYDLKFINSDGGVVDTSQLKNKKGALFQRFINCFSRYVTFIPAVKGVAEYVSREETNEGYFIDNGLGIRIDDIDRRVPKEMYESIKEMIAQGYMLFQCEVHGEVQGMLCFKHFVDCDMKTIAKTLHKYNTCMVLVSAERESYINSVVAQIQGGRPLDESMFKVKILENAIERRQYYKWLAQGGKSVCHIGPDYDYLKYSGAYSRVYLNSKRGVSINSFAKVQNVLNKAKSSFQYIKDVTKYVLICNIGKMLSVLFATITGVNILMPLYMYMVTGIIEYLIIGLFMSNNKVYHKAGSKVLTENDICHVLYNSVIFGMSIVFCLLTLLKWYPTQEQLNMEKLLMMCTCIMQMMIALVTWVSSSDKFNLKKFVSRLRVSALLLVTLLLVIALFGYIFRSVKLTILLVCLLGVYAVVNIIYNSVFRIKK